MKFKFFAQVLAGNGPRRFLEQLPVYLSAIFVIFVLSPAVEVVMFTNRSNYPPDAKQRQLAIFRRSTKPIRGRRKGPREQAGMPFA
ncbi:MULTISPECIES: hypothetical protein [Rhizobium]|uniref:hypothetical protein n=1 Tax=Rhizobium TaxID=379 RepID=UPI00104093DE|nr:hypothetical protein [Rhizobium leguminosarum]MBY5641302.1 hypothetical protein [Rhizobium leguminosarum]MBY5663076.1 hypothetical protein [Rhizobium leguminosarum]NKL99516.1 hypothetical protein [Rhizobium leguminosarum bv. viciae]TCA05925.1 hypothetical protein E0H57_13355 [Rhizobium leguminosarum bv. viciae]UFW77049.1 hypothetical protein RlegSU303_17575 [Rhizobium leguminosarum bv. viciae]